MVFDRSPSTSRRDVPRRETLQERPAVLTRNGASGLPPGTPLGTCDCDSCWPGVPLNEGDSFLSKCGCVNRLRVATHPELTVRFPGQQRRSWPESGGRHWYTYQGEGIYKTRLFDGPPCDEEGATYDEKRYYYKIDATLAIPQVTLEFDGDPETAACPIIVATWCFSDGCAFSCLCPWLFKRTMPFEIAESPPYCALCVTPIRSYPGPFCSAQGCKLTPFVAITIPAFSFGVSSQVAHPGDMDVALFGYASQSEWPSEIELPPCTSDAVGAVLSLADTDEDGIAATVLIPLQDSNGGSIRYAAWLTDAECPSGDIGQIRVLLTCTFNDDGDPILSALIYINFFASVVGGGLGAQNGCAMAAYEADIPLDEFCQGNSFAVDRDSVGSIPAFECGDDNLIGGDAQYPTRVFIQPYEPPPPNSSGQNAESCGGDGTGPVTPDCAVEACVLKATNLGEGLGKKWVVDTEATTCDACGSCYATGCSGTQDSVCGDANDYPDDYLCYKRCESSDPPTEDTVTVTFYADFGGSCPCGTTEAVLCSNGEGLYQSTVILCGETFNFSYYEDGGNWFLDGGPIETSAIDPVGPFTVAGVGDLTGCDNLQATVAP